MPRVYTTPGVYKEEFFLQPQAILPTGIPGFIGFADAIAPLEKLPDAIQFPDSFKNKIGYQLDQKLLVFKEVMSAKNRDDLLTLSTDQAYQKAIQFLYQSAKQQVVPLHRKQEFASQLQSPSESYLPEVVNGFFENSGTHCYVVRAMFPDPANPDKEQALKDALVALAALSDLDLVAIPDAMTLLDSEAILRVQQAALQHCTTQGDRIAILDAFPSVVNGQLKLTLKDIQEQGDKLVANQQEPVNGVLYYPWIKNTQDYPQSDNSSRFVKGRFVPPCGHIAGIISRSDRTRGVFKAPANEEIFDALDLEVAIDNSTQGDLNPLGINCLRAFPGRGIRVWGARTLSRDENWRYINIRRIFLTLARWIDRNMFWATFEPNTQQLWVRIQRELSSYLEQLWRAGALVGQTRDRAFYVKCDAETNPPESFESGEVVTEIGLAPSSPAEFIIVRILHRAGTIETG
jgi:hypothetical protein